jgi:hypothetical protein
MEVRKVGLEEYLVAARTLAEAFACDHLTKYFCESADSAVEAQRNLYHGERGGGRLI